MSGKSRWHLTARGPSEIYFHFLSHHILAAKLRATTWNFIQNVILPCFVLSESDLYFIQISFCLQILK